MTSSTRKQTLAALPGIGVSLLPKLMCPACWPAYAGLWSLDIFCRRTAD